MEKPSLCVPFAFKVKMEEGENKEGLRDAHPTRLHS